MFLDVKYWFLLVTVFVQINANKTFICVDGTEIELSKICNGIADCPDKSDETKLLCYHLICPKEMFRCHYGACVKLDTLCNGLSNCLDKSDESQCGRIHGSCEKSEFRCKSGDCISVNKICDETKDCPDGTDESADVCEEFFCPEDAFHCKHGGCIHKDSRCDGINNCLDGSDESKRLCDNLKCSGTKCNGRKEHVTCPPINSDRIEVKCEEKSTDKKGYVSCNKPIPAGTVARYECKQYFVPINEKHLKNTQSVCQMDGSWSRNILKCKPECGKSKTEMIPMVVHGWATKAKKYPWHATLYVLENGVWTFWCGGSLISEKAVLTAAHCTWKISPELMVAAFGKDFSDFNEKQSHSLVRAVDKIMMEPLYQDQSGNYGSDIAILILKDPVELSPLISPVCLDWNQEYAQQHLQGNSTGTIAGMGITENETFSNILRGVNLPVVSHQNCIKDQKKDFKKFVTFTTFCAGYKNGSGVCNGDSGGGLVFPFQDDGTKWMIQGLVSVSPRRHGTSFCDPQYYTIFTKVGVYIRWIKNILNSIHPNDVDESDLSRIGK